MKNDNTIEHLDKIFWPEKKYTKGDLITYYRALAATIVPHLKDRPISMSRYPDGIHGMHFFQKDLSGQHVPSFVKTTTLRATSTGKNVQYALCQNKKTLLYLAGLGSIEMHPWASRLAHKDKPDYVVFDIDPGARGPFNNVVEVAQTFHAILDKIGVKNFCKTSGKSGLHVYVPLGATYSHAQVREFAQQVSRVVNRQLPNTTTMEQRIAKRRGRVYLDNSRNALGQTTVCAYSLRPTPEATVSTPLLWSEVTKGLDPKKFTIKTTLKRLTQKGDLWRPTLRGSANLPRALKRLDKNYSLSANTTRRLA